MCYGGVRKLTSKHDHLEKNTRLLGNQVTTEERCRITMWCLLSAIGSFRYYAT